MHRTSLVTVRSRVSAFLILKPHSHGSSVMTVIWVVFVIGCLNMVAGFYLSVELSIGLVLRTEQGKVVLLLEHDSAVDSIGLSMPNICLALFEQDFDNII